MEGWINETRSYNSIFNITGTNEKFELCTDTFDDFPFKVLKDEIEEILSNSDITPFHLQQDNIRPSNIEALENLRLEKSSTDGCIILLNRYPRSPFTDFESYLMFIASLDDKDIQLIIKQYIWISVTYKLTPGFYTIKDISEAVYTMRDHEGTLQTENDDISKKKDLFNSFWRDFWNITRSWWTFFLLIFYWILHRFGIKNLLMQFMRIVRVYVPKKKL